MRKNGNAYATHSYHVRSTAKAKLHKYNRMKANSVLMRHPMLKSFLVRAQKKVMALMHMILLREQQNKNPQALRNLQSSLLKKLKMNHLSPKQ